MESTAFPSKEMSQMASFEARMEMISHCKI